MRQSQIVPRRVHPPDELGILIIVHLGKMMTHHHLAKARAVCAAAAVAEEEEEIGKGRGEKTEDLNRLIVSGEEGKTGVVPVGSATLQPGCQGYVYVFSWTPFLLADGNN